jgi:hypothetical protein
LELLCLITVVGRSVFNWLNASAPYVPPKSKEKNWPFD